MRRIAFIIVALIFTSVATYAQTVMVKSVEVYGSIPGIKGNIHIYDELGKYTEIKLEDHRKEGIKENMVTLKGVIDKYLQDGYIIIDSNSISPGLGSGAYSIEHTYIFKKE